MLIWGRLVTNASIKAPWSCLYRYFGKCFSEVKFAIICVYGEIMVDFLIIIILQIIATKKLQINKISKGQSKLVMEMMATCGNTDGASWFCIYIIVQFLAVSNLNILQKKGAWKKKGGRFVIYLKNKHSFCNYISNLNRRKTHSSICQNCISQLVQYLPTMYRWYSTWLSIYIYRTVPG